MINEFRICPMLFIIFLFIALPVSVTAHKLSVFAWSEGDIILGETSLSGNIKPHDLKITVQDAATHTTLLTTRTDEQGNFRFLVPEKAIQQQLGLLLVADSGDGHRGEWRLPAHEYLSLPLQQKTGTEKVSTQSMPTVQSTACCMSEQVLRRIVDEELDSKLGPVKQMLAENYNQGPSLQNILGGIGYILGLAGILAWSKARNCIKNTRRNEL
jgi:nickel transport protein